MSSITCCFPVRILIIILLFISTFIVYICRSNINVTIIAMTNVTSKSRTVSNNSCPDLYVPKFTNSSMNNWTENSTSNDTSDQSINHDAPRYEWDQSAQGEILGAFFYSYFILQIPVAIFVQKFGGKWIIAVSLIGSGVVNLGTPIIASSYWMVIVSRVVLGAVQAATYPAIYDMMCAWIPIKERSLSYAIIESGGQVGSIASSAVAGYISEQTKNGWPSVFYLCGGLAIGYSVIFILLSKSSPEEHALISKGELKYILDAHAQIGKIQNEKDDQIDENENNKNEKMRNKNEENERKSERKVENGRGRGNEENERETKSSTPWMAIITSKVVLSTIAVKFGGGYVYYTLSSKLPSYLSEVIHEDLTKNGLLNSITYLIAATSAIICGGLSERVIQWDWLSRTNTRKTFSLIANVGMAVSIALVPTAGCSEFYVMVLVLTCYFFLGFISGGDVPVPGELTKNYPAIVYSYMNAMSITTGFIAPKAIGYTLEGFHDVRFGWSIVFYTAAVVTLTGNAFFILFGSAERQPFDYIKHENDTTTFWKFWKRYSNEKVMIVRVNKIC